MFNPPKVDEWQWLDESNGLWFPWLTLPALEEVNKWNLTGKYILEFGGGKSTLWWANKAAHVTTVESNRQWFEVIIQLANDLGYNMTKIYDHGEYITYRSQIAQKCLYVTLRECNEGDQQMINFYPFISDGHAADIVVVDGIFRYECIVNALLNIPRPFTLIVDNWQQDYIFICPAAEELMKDYEGHFFVQPDHTNHEGRPWTTAIWHLI